MCTHIVLLSTNEGAFSVNRAKLGLNNFELAEQ